MATKIFFIQLLTNMHVGSGEVNYGLVDKLIQRDPVTNLPHIGSSSLKGALREHFEKQSQKKIDVKLVFGSEPDAKTDRQQGAIRFFDAELVSLAARCSGNTLTFVNVTSNEQLARIANQYRQLDAGNTQFLNSIGNLPNLQKDTPEVDIEDIGKVRVCKPSKFSWVAGENVAVVQEEHLVQLCDDTHLPIITRNQLNDGVSGNLFYEQVLPRFSHLATIMMGDEKVLDNLCQALDGELVQIGANATIGYGFCQFKLYPQPTNTPQQ